MMQMVPMPVRDQPESISLPLPSLLASQGVMSTWVNYSVAFDPKTVESIQNGNLNIIIHLSSKSCFCFLT